MLYAILCYDDEQAVAAWPAEQDAQVMADLKLVETRLARAGRLGPVARLLPTTAAVTLRKSREDPLVLDGPFAETKEQLLGFFIVECASLEQALETARELAQANGHSGSYEVRPVGVFHTPQQLLSEAPAA